MTDAIIKGEGIDTAQIDEEILGRINPKRFGGSKGAEVQAIKGFEQDCIIINQFIPKDPKQMTVLEFYQALEFIQKQVKANGKSYQGK